MKRAYYSQSISQFIDDDPNTILGGLTRSSEFAVEHKQRDAWLAQVKLLKTELAGLQGSVYFEFSIPRMGSRVDVLLITGPLIVVIEFKVGETTFTQQAIDQVTDYALDLKNFHETSHDFHIVPVLIATKANSEFRNVEIKASRDTVSVPICGNGSGLGRMVCELKKQLEESSFLNSEEWEKGRYRPTPTIIEAAKALYNGHAVAEISRSDASGEELHRTTETIEKVIEAAQDKRFKAVCFVTGVPGAGKTLIGLNVATKYSANDTDAYSVFLSGNGPLVKILQEALARDKVAREAELGNKIKKSSARSEVKSFIQNVHHYRDECIRDPNPPVDHVAIFDEAQRAWNLAQTSSFMRTKKGQDNFEMSEPEFLLSCVDRHLDWGVVVCLIGGGQEINTGEGGIGEWIDALQRAFPDWHVYISDRLHESEFGSGEVVKRLETHKHVQFDSNLHLSVSMRSFRSEHVSKLVKEILDFDQDNVRSTFQELNEKYPIVLTRDLERAKSWLRKMARGSERYGIVVSSQASRLKPLAIDVRLKPDPIHWFLADKSDARSSYYLEDVATEFDIQGLELDWACVAWDADLRLTKTGWSHHSFRGNRWQNIRKPERQVYLKNAYRVLLTRARQGMVIFVPEGNPADPTRDPEFYEETYRYLRSLDLPIV